MVVASPIPSTPSLQRTRNTTRVCCCMVCIASLCGRMVGRSTIIASMRSISALVIVARSCQVGLPVAIPNGAFTCVFKDCARP
jgi:hypothetical protein